MKSIFEWLLGTPQQQQLAEQADWGFKFLRDYGPFGNPLLFAVMVAMVYLVVRSYKREGQAKPAVKATLAGLRLATIVIVMAILFQPAIVLRVVKTVHSWVVVLVDDSQSMSYTDRYANDAAYQQRLAEFLKVEPAKLAATSRLQIAKDALLRPDGAIAKLAQDHPMVVMKFSTTQPGKESYTRRLANVEVLPATGGAAQVPDALVTAMQSLTGSGYATNLAEALRGALDNLQGQRLAGVLLVSDGQPTTEDADSRLSSALAYAAQRNVPIYPVSVGDPTLPKNIVVSSLQAPREARKSNDSNIDFVTTIAHRNLEGQAVLVKLQRRAVDQTEWVEVAQQETRLPTAEEAAATGATKGVQNVTIKCKPDAVGTFVYRASVEPRADEQNVSDNSSEALVRVVDSKINVLLISGDGGWEFQYLRNFLQRQSELYRLSVWQQNAEKEVSQAASSDEMRLERMPHDLVDLIGDKKDLKKPGYHVVILYDPQHTQEGFDARFVGVLKEFVAEHGGGLCYIAGNKYTDENLLSKGPLIELAGILPVELGTNVSAGVRELLSDRPPEPWRAVVTSYGMDHQITRLGDSSESNAKIWNMLPGIYWSHPIGRLKPAARVLLETENPARQTTRGEREPLLALQMYGKGPVVYVGTDDTWRWRMVDDSRYHKRFWNNVVGFLATLRASRVVITTGGDAFNAGDQIKIDVEAYDEKYRPLADPTFTIQVADVQTGKSEILDLVKTEGKDGRYRGTFVAAHQGTLEFSAKGIEGAEAKRVVIRLPEAEAIRSEADEDTMKALASPKAENFHRICDIDNLAKIIPPGKLTSIQEHPRELWDTPLWLIVLVVLLATEWIFRKKYNMA